MKPHPKHPEIRVLEPGDIISSPGLYACDIEVHHSMPVEGIAVTSSVLRRADTHTLADVFAFAAWNEHRYPDKDTDAKRMGRAMAYIVEGGDLENGIDLLLDNFRVLPADAPRRPTKVQIEAYGRTGKWSDAAAPGAAFWAAWDEDPRGTLDDGEYADLVTMGAALLRDPAARVALGGIPEITIAWQDARTGIWVLSRPDVMSLDGMCVDFKRMNTQGRPFNRQHVDRKITEFRMDMQMALACEGLEATGYGWPSMAAILAQCDSPPYHAIVQPIVEEDLRIGQWSNRQALDRIAQALKLTREGKPHYIAWPGPGADIGYYQRPEYQQKRLQEQMDQTTAPGSPDDIPDPITTQG